MSSHALLLADTRLQNEIEDISKSSPAGSSRTRLSNPKRQQVVETYEMISGFPILMRRSLDFDEKKSARGTGAHILTVFTVVVHMFQISAALLVLSTVYAPLMFSRLICIVLALMATTVDNTYFSISERYVPEDPVIYTRTSTAYDSHGNSVQLTNITVGPNGSLFDAAQFGPTVIPLLFSFVVPMTLWLFARWKAQAGAKLGVSFLTVPSQLRILLIQIGTDSRSSHR